MPHVFFGSAIRAAWSDVSLPILSPSYSSYSIRALGDLDGDGRSDIYLNGTNLASGLMQHTWYGKPPSARGFDDISASPLAASFSNYAILGVGDFDGDGRKDMYLNQANLGNGAAQHVFYGRSNRQLLDMSFTPLAASFQNYGVLAVGDFNHDGRGDMYLNSPTNLASGLTQYFFEGRTIAMGGGFVSAGLGILSGSDYTNARVLASGDFNADGATDLYINSNTLGLAQTIAF